MPRTGTVNYHVHKPGRQAFQIDADGVAGNLISPELVATDVAVRDVRREEASVSFEADSLSFVRASTDVASFGDDEAWRETYEQELRSLLEAELSAEEVLIFDHTVRVDDPHSDRKPARNVHSDYSEDGAKQRLIDLLGEAEAARWSKARFGLPRPRGDRPLQCSIG